MQDYRPHVTYLAKQREALRAHLGRIKDNREKHKRQGIALVETMAGAAVAGVIQGHAGEGGSHILKMPTSLVVGGLAVAGGVLQAGRFSDHLIAFGTGFLAEFAGNWGYGVGQRKRTTGSFGLFGKGADHALPGATHTSGALSPHDMANLVRQVHAAG
jgi:hypothetical protein